MIGLHTPYDLLSHMIQAAEVDPDAPGGGLMYLNAVRNKLKERGLLNMAMTASAVEALIDEQLDAVLEAEKAEQRAIASFDSSA